ncbi:MAG: electron transport complex subunit RsxC [Prevotellaceae bacterium]|jgi:electron transport complex protein RnfC|nr:electron transport complex subunit RsxC [Prevotellaceae bacterium]
MSKTFSMGGVHPHDNKISANIAIEPFPLPAIAAISLAQHIGAPATPVVQKGDFVRVGQLIGKATGFVSANVHASVSGTVKSVEPFVDATGALSMTIFIETQGDEWIEGIDRSSQIVSNITLPGPEIIKKITECGIVGLGGATFPTHVKLSPPPGKKATCLILNGAECEPFLTSDYRIMVEFGEEVLTGARLMMRALDVQKCYVGIEENKPQAIQKMVDLSKRFLGTEVVVLKKKYPQGGEKQLIDAIIKRQTPSLGLPVDVGAVVQNVGTALAVYEAVQKNKPLIDKVITVTGFQLNEQRNFRVRIGTPLSQLIDAVGGIPENTAKLVLGGPMMGKSIAHQEAPVAKASSALLFLSEKETKRHSEGPCIRCAKCVEVCPMRLECYLLYKLGKANRYEELEQNRIYDCIECGCCMYGCPANIPLLDMVRLKKGEVLKIMKNR